jgi:hypothetical protein
VAIPIVWLPLLVGGAALILVLAVRGAVLLLTRDRGPWSEACGGRSGRHRPGAVLDTHGGAPYLLRGITRAPRPMLKPLCLCLSVLLTPADDAWSQATPAPDDDVRATANNDYTAPATDDAAPVAPRPAPLAGLLPGGRAARGPAAAPAPPGSPGLHPLCLLMSLLR